MPEPNIACPMDTRTCVVYNLAIHLEEFLNQHPRAILLFTQQTPGTNAVKSFISR